MSKLDAGHVGRDIKHVQRRSSCADSSFLRMCVEVVSSSQHSKSGVDTSLKITKGICMSDEGYMIVPREHTSLYL